MMENNKVENWLANIRKVANVHASKKSNDITIRFTHSGVIALYSQFREFIENCELPAYVSETLSTFGEGLIAVFNHLMHTPVGLTVEEFNMAARVLLGFQFVQIFGTASITPTIKQIAVYTGYFINQAKQDGNKCGLPLSLFNFTDSIMEASHARSKCVNMVFSGGRRGCIGNK